VFSLIAFAYRSNGARGVPPSFAAVGMGLAGVLWFGWRSFAGPEAPGWSAPTVVWVWGLVNGVAQGIGVYLYRVGMKHGPLAPIWCAGNLTFLAPALFAAILIGERLTGLQMVGMAAAFLCVTVSSMGHGEEPGEGGPQRATPGQRALYGAVLLGLALLTGLLGVALKHLSLLSRDGIPLNPRYNDCFMLSMYAIFLAWVAAEAARFGRPAAASVRRVVWNGLLGGVGSVGGMVLLASVSSAPGGTVFAVESVSCVLCGALITSFGFHEKRGRAWYATLVLAVAAVVLFNLK
jgi:drug/metabolite transporter (DMT)-like permease